MERVETLTAQGRMQAVVCGAIPFALYGLLFVWQPDYVQPLFKSTVGKVAIYAVVLFQVLVILIVRKIVNIRI
jgi:Flp pilus assembly protein TadB